jgi:hypothetical protein
MRRTARRLCSALVLVAWFAQLCLPVAHAALMAAPGAGISGWCGDPSRARAFLADLPAEIREGLDLNGTAAVDHALDCAQLCATCSPPPIVAVAATVVLRAAGLEPEPQAVPAAPRSRAQARTPPSQGPPALV